MEEIEFEHIAAEMRPKLTAHCHRYIDASPLAIDAEDIVQETLMRLWKMRDKLFQYQSIEALAMTIAKNLSIDYLRRDHQRAESLDLDATSNSSSTINRAVSTMASDQALIGEDTQRRLEQALSKLPSTQRRMLMMRSEGMSLEEIAATCGANKTSTKTMISAARRTLLKYITNKKDNNIWQ